MGTNIRPATLTTNNTGNPYLATSPPAWNPNMPTGSLPVGSPMAEATQARTQELTTSSQQQANEFAPQPVPIPSLKEAPTSTTVDTINPDRGQENGDRPYVSKIGILTSSLPAYHNAFMEAREKDKRSTRLQEQGQPLDADEMNTQSRVALNDGPKEQSSEEQAETMRRLKPHSRSTIQLQHITEDLKMQSLGTPGGTEKTRPRHKTTKWQFGIRSRNEPVDAMKCLFRALDMMPWCSWRMEAPKAFGQANAKGEQEIGPFPVTVQGATHIPHAEHNLSESPEKDRHGRPGDYLPAHKIRPRPREPRQPTVSHPSSPDRPNFEDSGYSSENDSDVDANVFYEGYAPENAWVIHVRWQKNGMAAPGVPITASAQSSVIDLHYSTSPTHTSSGVYNDKRRPSAASYVVSGPSTNASTTSVAGVPRSIATGTCSFVYFDLQIYVLEQDVYLVDFKNAGYEAIVGERKVLMKKNRRSARKEGGEAGGHGAGEGEWAFEAVGSGRRLGDKDVTSPQPFLDLAMKLVIHLAKGGH